ncbi:formyltransferase family protein [Streptomyces sp. NPDC086023]|uniref:formyltransferase family protein n=1 Tax=Streptomyces sp. NPDC086023 TaxID=3365746 RepID=UPI0037D4E5E2
MSNDSVLFIGDNSRWSELASAYLTSLFPHTDTVLWDHGGKRPAFVDSWQGDRIFCFKADLILTPDNLASARKSAINFHPAIPTYRGIGGYDWVINDGGTEFGATAHHINAKIDAGPIIKVVRFPINAAEETAEGLSERTAAYCLTLFYEIVGLLHDGADLPLSPEVWGPRLYTRAMLTRFRAGEGAPFAHELSAVGS